MDSTRTDWICTRCKARIWKEEGYYRCDCSEVGIYEVDIGAYEFFTYWTKEKEESDETSRPNTRN